MNRIVLLCTSLLPAFFAPVPGNQTAQDRVLDCRKTFPPDVSEADLSARFGSANVVAGPIQLGEGDSGDGTVLFGERPEDRAEILWTDKRARQRPDWVRVSGQSTHWRTPEGITLGADLRSIERLNARPFRLLGFQWDYEGTVTSWSGGRLDRSYNGQPCQIRLRLAPEEWLPLAGQVSGDREFSSGHPAMRALNPRVYELWLSYSRD